MTVGVMVLSFRCTACPDVESYPLLDTAARAGWTALHRVHDGRTYHGRCPSCSRLKETPVPEHLHCVRDTIATVPIADPKALKSGQVVVVRRDDGRHEIRVVKYGVWQFGHGTFVVGLVGIAGGYALERVVGFPDLKGQGS